MSMPKKTLRHHNIQVFRPTIEQFKDFNGLIKHMEEKGAHRAGIAKIIPPPEWKPRKDNYNHEEIEKIEIPVPIRQHCEGDHGLYFVYNCVGKPMTVSKFKEMCEKNIKTPKDHSLVEKCYWKNLQKNPPTYGADVSGTITDDDCKYFNIAKLGTILDIVEQDYQTKIEGVNTAYLYFGMYRSMFPWHTEDMDLYSINYIHFGAPKTWYAIPPEHGRRFERLAAAFFPQEAANCQSFLRHKSTVISLDNIEKYGIPYDTIIQKENEIIITFPYGYHAGFNHGYNCAESTNFASERWIDYGIRATLCCCKSSEDVVKICMKTFVQRFQPEKFDKWCAGLDDGRHPEHHERSFAGPESLRIVLNEKNRSHRLIPKGPILQEINYCPNINFSFDSDYDQSDEENDIENLEFLEIPPPPSKETPYKKPTNRIAPKKNCRMKRTKQNRSSITNKRKKAMESTGGKKRKLSKTIEKKIEINENLLQGVNGNNIILLKNERKSLDKEAFSAEYVKSEPLTEMQIVTTEQQEFQWPKHLEDILAPDPSLELLQTFNTYWSGFLPHCSMCAKLSIIGHKSSAPVENDWHSYGNSIGESQFLNKTPALINSKVLASNSLNDKDKPLDHFFEFSVANEERALIKCKHCLLIVHDRCYGVQNVSKNTQDWLCDPCYNAKTLEATCSFCPVKGGALKRATNGQWVHVLCALFSGAEFKETNTLEPINVIDILRQKDRCKKCKYCHKQEGILVMCEEMDCNEEFHFMCGVLTGAEYSIPINSFKRTIRCNAHKIEKRFPPLRIAKKALGKSKNTRYYEVLIEQFEHSFCSKVTFENGQTCENLPLKDIIEYANTGKIPEIGSSVEVQWKKDAIFSATFEGIDHNISYSIRFDDGSVLKKNRSHIYRLDEDIPEKVKRLWSRATEMQHPEMFYGSGLTNSAQRKSKRPEKL
ncbi:hypothetical protein TKK_0018264 [Trichogramma kaykai]|uniref:[histone H3]-trimethyl-L-lysine(9) demethylase n=1 Tax=Trichogramma kaykai TaxID=54128 RepID=A0ABD2W014_9HYME